MESRLPPCMLPLFVITSVGRAGTWFDEFEPLLSMAVSKNQTKTRSGFFKNWTWTRIRNWDFWKKNCKNRFWSGLPRAKLEPGLIFSTRTGIYFIFLTRPSSRFYFHANWNQRFFIEVKNCPKLVITSAQGISNATTSSSPYSRTSQLYGANTCNTG